MKWLPQMHTSLSSYPVIRDKSRQLYEFRTELNFLAPLNLENQEAYEPFHDHLWPNKVEYSGISVEFRQRFEVSTSNWMQWIFLLK